MHRIGSALFKFSLSEGHRIKLYDMEFVKAALRMLYRYYKLQTISQQITQIAEEVAECNPQVIF